MILPSVDYDNPGDIDLQLARKFQRLVNLEFFRSGLYPPSALIDPSDGSLRARYAPMQRLLVSENPFLIRNGLDHAVLRKLSRAHHRCYFEFLAELKREVRAQRRQCSAVMESIESWDVRRFVSQLVFSEAALLCLRWMGWRKSLGLAVDVGFIGELLDQLLLGAILPSEARTA